MSATFVIDVWSDVVCPFCYIGSVQLDQAIEQFEHDVDVTYHAFELDPEAPASSDEALDEILATKYQMPVERARTMNARLAAQGAQLGLTLSFETVRRANSFDAHRLIDLATTQGGLVINGGLVEVGSIGVPLGSGTTPIQLGTTGNNQIVASNFTSTNMQYSPGGPGDTVVVRMFYQWPLFVTGLGFNIANLSGNKRLLVATAAFQNEPY